MAFNWLKGKRESTHQTKPDNIKEWEESYFQNIRFPIIILKKDDYLCVSDLPEYFYDVDINIWYVDDTCELIDSMGQKYNFKKIKEDQWVPNNKIGEINYQDLKNRVTPLLLMPQHKQDINKANNIKGLIEMLFKE